RRWFRRVIILVPLILVVAALLWFLCFAGASSPRMSGRIFIGQIPGLGTVFVEVPLTGTNTTGWSAPGAKSFRIEGTKSAAGNWELQVIDRNREPYATTDGVITGDVDGRPPVFRGEWLPNRATNPVAFELRQMAEVCE